LKSINIKYSQSLRTGSIFCINSEVKNKLKDIGINSSIARREDPLHILKVRLAKGEINKEEYDEILKALE
jgi:uncharacterized membrane protein